MIPKLDGIDHVHVYVSNREDAAAWYEKVLGFRVNQTLAVWAKHDKGPLTIEDASGQIHLALFKRDNFVPSNAIAFKTNGREFLKWKSYLEKVNILLRCTDHEIAWSVYFNDPDNNIHEITTYEHSYVTTHLGAPNA